MRRALAWILTLLVICTPARAYAEALDWRAAPTASCVEAIKSGTTWNAATIPGYTDLSFGYAVQYQTGRIADTAGGDNYDSLLTESPATRWIQRPYAVPSQPGTYTTVSDWTAQSYRTDATDKSLRVWPSGYFTLERRNPPAATETVLSLSQSSTGYWPDQAAPTYSLDATSVSGLDYRYTNDTEPCDQGTDSDGNLMPVTSRGLLLVTYRPRAGANIWDVYVGMYAHVSGSSATDYRAAVTSFTVNASTAATAYAPISQTYIAIGVPGLVRLADPAGVPPDYSPATLVQGDVYANLIRETYYSATTAASDRVAAFVQNHEGIGWGTMLSEAPTTSVPPTQSVPATATTPTIPATTTPGADWYAVITDAVAPLKGLLWPLDLFGRLAGK